MDCFNSADISLVFIYRQSFLRKNKVFLCTCACVLCNAGTRKEETQIDSFRIGVAERGCGPIPTWAICACNILPRPHTHAVGLFF